QPRTLELWDRMGLVRAALDAAVPMRGQLLYTNGTEQARFELALPPEVPYGFAALPQYETERILDEFLTSRYGTAVERGTELVSFVQDAEGVTSVLRTPSGAQEEVRTRYLVGCDGAHSIVRKGLGLSYEGGAFPEEYMLADVEVDWDLPHGYAVRSVHRDASGAVDDVLVCIPLPGRARYRMSMLVPPGLSAQAVPDAPAPDAAPSDGIAHGLQSGRAPGLPEIQAVLDRLSPRTTTASGLRWASVFRISHRIVNRYAVDRVFVAGDAAHIHPPTGAQGMNTGIQDAWNLAWKLALAVDGSARPGLLPSYDTERRPVGEEVVGRTVRHAEQGVQADPEDTGTLMLREAQLLVGYRGSPVVDPPGEGPGPRPGDRAPDCTGLTGQIETHPLRLYDLLRDTGHVLLLYGTGEGDARWIEELARTAREASGGRMRTCLVLAPGAPPWTGTPAAHRDTAGQFARLYAADRPTAFAVRPDGYLGARISPPDPQALAAHLAAVFAPDAQRPSAPPRAARAAS
ncbi:FAD-dependent monooxygenase, partial [Streptomyces xanthophaeus]